MSYRSKRNQPEAERGRGRRRGRGERRGEGDEKEDTVPRGEVGGYQATNGEDREKYTDLQQHVE